MNASDTEQLFEVFYDGQCAICTREINMLRKLDRRQRIVFTDIADASFDALGQTGRTYETLMDEIHGRFEDGTVVTGVEVFRQLYARVGLGWAVGITRLFGVRQGLDLGYKVFAKNRLRLTGRCIDEACSVSPESEEPAA